MAKKNTILAALMLVLICASAALLTGCGTEQEDWAESTKDLFAMDTYMSFTAYGEDSAEAVEAAAERVRELDYMLTAVGYDDESSADCEIYAINENGSGSLSEDTDALVSRALELNELTEGAFNPCMYVIMEAWGFTTDNYRVPSDEELLQLLELTDVSQLKYDADEKTLTMVKEGMKIDLGGIAKGYTSAAITEVFEEHEIKSALINLGGNVHALGTKPDGSEWRVGIQDPENSSAYLGVLSVTDKAVITSGGYERYFEEDGKTYHHIIDPETGHPVENDVESMTIVSEDGTLADALSTALFVMGKDAAQQFWQKYGAEYGFEIIIVDDNFDAYVSEGIADDYQPEEGYEVIVINK